MIQHYYVFAFGSTHAAIEAGRLLAPVKAVVMPTPRVITASCGMSLRLEDEYADEGLRMMKGSGIGSWRYYEMSGARRDLTSKLLAEAES